MNIGINYNNCSNPKQNPSFGKKITFPVKVYGDIQKTFVDEINTGLNQFPGSVLGKIKKAGLVEEIRLAPKHSEAFPEFPSVQDLFRKTIDADSNGIVGEINNDKGIPLLKFMNFIQLPKLPADRGIVCHELGHKVDGFLKEIIGIPLSQTESFKEAVKNDLTRLSKTELTLWYKKWRKVEQGVIQEVLHKCNPNDINPKELKEIFADCTAANITGTQGELKAKEKFMAFFFPESCKYVDKFMYLMGQR